uniref:Uncharacterized protein n=1 Tax=Tanacetum cinerariifolium TaxID=118510 RepID=A0A6L2LNG8_TANCI|nr:hypothetical protein [Tanacetum cinerariifolium]
MHNIGKMLAELHAMQKLHEKGIPKKVETSVVLAIREGKIQKDKKKKPQGEKGKAKGNNKLSYAPKTKTPPLPKRDNPTKDSICHHYKKVGHWRRNCLSYHAELKKKKNARVAGTSGIFTIELYAFPNKTWVYDTAHILNMVPTKKVDRTPYEIWHGKAPKFPYLRFWGCEALVKRDMPNKLDSRSIKCIFVGYLKETMTYYFYYPLKNKIFVSQNAEFFENSFMEYELGDFDEPPIYKATLIDPESDKWLKAMNTKIQSMKDNQVWYLVDLPSNGRTAGCKWLLKKNTDMDGNVHNFKAHLVAKGFTQTYGVDYGETFSPVAYIRAIRILLAIVVFYDYKICAYLEKILKKFRMENSKKGYTSMIENPDYRKSQGAKTPTEQNPGEIHWTAVKTILKYLRNTKDMVLVYGAKPREELKKSDKQSTTTMSFTEAEYIAATKVSMEAVWMRKFIDGLGGVMPSNKRHMEMLRDNVLALAIANDPKILKGVRHF